MSTLVFSGEEIIGSSKYRKSIREILLNIVKVIPNYQNNQMF